MFQVETYLAFIDGEMPVQLDRCRKATAFLDPEQKSDPMKDRSRKLFAMLASWIQECPAGAKLSRGIRNQNGFELWRLLWREFQPENHSKSLIWRKTLLSPKFPAREAEFSSALQEWEADLDRYEAEYGQEKAISDEDKRAVVITEAPAALRQHLAMHTGTLSDYHAVRDVVVSYLQAKRTWVPSAAYAGSPARRDLNAMEIAQVGDGGKPNPHKGKNKTHRSRFRWLRGSRRISCPSTEPWMMERPCCFHRTTATSNGLLDPRLSLSDAAGSSSCHTARRPTHMARCVSPRSETIRRPRPLRPMQRLSFRAMKNRKQWPLRQSLQARNPEGDLEADVPESGLHSADAPAVPAAPTAAERSAHQLTHLPFQQWCELCVAGKAKEDHHRRRVVADEVQSERLPIIQMDYMFLGRHGEDVEAESALMTILVAVDLETALENLELFLNKLGYDKCILQHDAEHAVGAVARALQRHVGARRLQVRSAPVRSHQSQGAVESANAFLAGQIRTLWADLRERYPALEPSHNSVPWLVRHASWLVARFHVRQRDEMTPYKLTQGSDYNRPVRVFGEQVLAKVPIAESKLGRKWLKGVRQAGERRLSRDRDVGGSNRHAVRPPPP